MAIVAALAAMGACRSGQPSASKTTAATNNVVSRGGSLIASIRTEPGSFNRYVHRDAGADLVSLLTHAKLVRVNKATQTVEPWLADSWSASEDGRAFTLKLHPGATFSDGQPLTADDVVFSFQAVYDLGADGPLGDSLQVEGRKLEVTAVDASTVSIVFPVTYAPGVRILDNLPILPKHRLEAALRAGKMHDAWGLSTPPSELAGLGPFVLAEYVPGQRLVFNRNPRYFRKAADGTALPYLDRVTVEITPDPNTELLRLEAGQIDAMTNEIAPESYATIKRAADAGKVKLADLGVGYNADALWFNLKPGAFAGDPRAAWLQRDELRKAISLAVDRKIFADTVFLGAAEPVYGPETPANKQWYWGRPTAHDPAAARQLLASIGLTDRDGDGMLEDAGGRAARFTLLTQKGRPNLERSVAVIRDELKKIGVTVDVVALEGLALIERFSRTRQYEAVYFTVSKTDTDPAVNLDFWASYGGAHIWNFAQKTPATDWERRIDELIVRQIAAPDPTERKRLYDQIQEIFADHLPMVYFAAPRIFVASSVRMINVTPALLRPQLLWAPETVAVVIGPLSRYIARRLAFAALLVIVVSSASMILARLAPGDYVDLSLPPEASAEAKAQARARLGLDRSIGAQYLDWLGAAVRLDFGRSFLYDRPVRELIPERAANTAVLALTALAVATVVGLPLGVVSGSRGGPLSGTIRFISLVLLSMPPLLTSLFLVFVAARTGWFPIGGMGESTTEVLHHLVLPAMAIGLPLAAVLERLQAQAMGEVIRAPFVLAALARGVTRSRVVWHSALKPSLRQVAAVYGLIVGSLLSGSFVVEVITAWPGLGSLMLDALRARDIYLVTGCAGMGALFLACGTLFSDLALGVVDPRASERVQEAAS